MTTAKCASRVGGLAAVVGVGAVVLGAGIAAAEPESENSAATASVAAGRSTPRQGAPQGSRRTTRTSTSTTSRTSPQPAAAAPRPRVTSALKDRPSAASSTTVEANDVGAVAVSPVPVAGTPALAIAASVAGRLPAPASASTAFGSLLQSLRVKAQSMFPAPTSAAISRLGTVPKLAGLVSNPDFVNLFLTSVLQLGVVTAVGTIGSPQSPTRTGPQLVLNGYSLVPESPATVGSIYPQWTYLPGTPGLFQGTQQFAVVDQTTSAKIGTFDAIVSRGGSFNYQELLVTANDGVNVGTAAGQVPPVGSLISTFGIGRFGLSYSAMPSPSGDVVSLKLATPYGEFTIPFTFDAARGIADHTVDNRPVDLGNGYRIAPADPSAEKITAISGLLPVFTTVQGNQAFNVYDSAGTSVGSFNGAFTTTSDSFGTYTQAILVTDSHGDNVGTAVGQVPPTGTVYNVIYSGSDSNYHLYTSMPSASGSVISLIHGQDGDVTDLDSTFIDASTAPGTGSITAPNGHRFVPVSELQPTGVNGLPPREVQVQGYQQFDAYDAAGNRLGAFGADVASQWDWYGIHSQALLVTSVTQGASGGVPPVGSVFNVVTFGTSGFGAAQSVIPTPIGDLVSTKIVTPSRDIPVVTNLRPVTARAHVAFVDRFAPAQPEQLNA